MIDKTKFKKFVEENLIIRYKDNIGLNSVKLRREWFENNGFIEYYNYIHELTNFLDINRSIGERIYCIINNITEIPTCLICKKNCSFKTYSIGYRNNCGKKECYVKLKSIVKDSNGLTPNERSGIGNRIALKKICSNGKSVAENRAIKCVETKKRIDAVHGKTLSQITAEKTANTNKTTICENGLTIAQNGALKAAHTMQTTLIDGTNETINHRRLKKTHLTKEKIGEDGLDGYERAFIHGAGRNSALKYYNTSLFYQGSYEKHFLDFMQSMNKLHLVHRGARIKYFDEKDRTYRSDFQIGNKFIDIKSNWTYYGLNKSKLMRNNLKFKATVDNGYDLIIIYNKKYLFKISKETFNFKSILDDILDLNNAILFTEKNFIQLIGKNEEDLQL